MKAFIKNLLIIVVTFTTSVLSVNKSFAQTTKTWKNTISSGFWGTGTNWTNGAPSSSTDIVKFESNATVTVDGSFQIGKLQISNSATVIFQQVSTNDYTITVNAGTSDAITIASGSTLIITGSSSSDKGIILTTANTSGLQANISGTVTVRSTANGGRGSLSRGTNAIINFNPGSIYLHEADGGTVPPASWSDNSFCNITGRASISNTTPEQSFFDLTLNTANTIQSNISFNRSFTVRNDFKILSTGSGTPPSYGTLNFASNNPYTITVKNFIFSGGTFNMSTGSATGILNVSGNFTHASGATIIESGSGSGSIVFNGTSAQTFTSGGTVSNTINYTVNNGAILQMAAANTVVSGNSFTLSSGGTLDIKSADGITAVGSSTGNIQTSSSRTYSTGASYIYSGGDQNVGNGLKGAKNLTLSGTGTKTFATANFTSNTNVDLIVAVDMNIATDVKANIPAGKNIAVANKFYIGGQGTFNLSYGSSSSPANYKKNNFFTDLTSSSLTTGTVTAQLSSLPVTLSYFSAKSGLNNTVNLSWSTSTEIVNKGFRIERQSAIGNGKFENIGFVASKAPEGGNSSVPLYYSFADVAPASNATNYYRLAQVDLDGKTTYSDVKLVRVGGETVTMVYPNPSTGVVNISRSAAASKMNVQILDMSGRMVQQYSNVSDANFQLNINKAGMYNVKLINAATGEQTIQRIVVQK